MRRVSFRATGGGVTLGAERGLEVGGSEHRGAGDVHPAHDAVGGLAAKREVERVGGLGDGGGGHRGVDVRRIGVGEEQRERGSGGCIVHDGGVSPVGGAVRVAVCA